MADVWVVVFKHDHGSDVSVFANEASADTYVLDTVREIMDEDHADSDDDGAKMIRRLLDEDNAAEVIGEWYEFTGLREDFEIRCCEIQDLSTGLDRLADIVQGTEE